MSNELHCPICNDKLAKYSAPALGPYAQHPRNGDCVFSFREMKIYQWEVLISVKDDLRYLTKYGQNLS